MDISNDAAETMSTLFSFIEQNELMKFFALLEEQLDDTSAIDRKQSQMSHSVGTDS